MATQQATIDFLLDQLVDLRGVTARKMFGEYALYAGGKVVALVCDEQLFVKDTAAGREFAGERVDEGYPYPGAKVALRVAEDDWERRGWLTELLTRTADALPEPKPKKEKAKKKRA
jgi:TfoX/Sxy family transcriptional regulator of competence genes